MTPHPYQSDVVLIGGGHSHVQVVKMLTMKRALPQVRFTMISDESVAYYSGMCRVVWLAYIAWMKSKWNCGPWHDGQVFDLFELVSAVSIRRYDRFCSTMADLP